MSGTTGHIYEFNGIRYPSVTTILDRTETKEEKQFFRNWRRKFSMTGFKNAEDYVNYTKLRGTLVHYNVTNSLHFSTQDPSGLPKLSDWWSRRDVLIAEIDHCKKLWNAVEIELKGPLVIETPTHHPLLMYAGTPDIQATGSHLLIDLKTSAGMYDKHKTQLGGYAQMINYHKPGTIKKAVLVYLNPKMVKALVVPLDEEDLLFEAHIFNEKVKEFWNIPGIKAEYRL